MLRKKACLLLSAVMFICTTAGCGQKKEAAKYPSDGEIPKKLTIFANLGSHAKNAGAKSNNDITSFKLMEKKTGCHVEWTHPAAGAETEKFNLMIASGNLPDMIVYEWSTVPGGAKMYYEDDMILELGELIDKNMPNLKAFNTERPEVKKQYTNDDGKIYYIPFIRKDKELKVFLGPQIRKDWLLNLQLKEPKTTDELREVLRAFKTQDPNGNGKADEIPMSGIGFKSVTQGIGNLCWAFGTHYDFYIDGDSVKYGILEQSFTEALDYIRGLYEEGLIDKDFLLNDRSKMDAKVINNNVGFVYNYQPSNYYGTMNDGTRKIEGIEHLTGPHGDKKCYVPDYANDVTKMAAAITTANENPVGTAKWLDEFFGGKGLEYMNFGEEGKTFTWDNGYPRLTDNVLHNPDGKDTVGMLAKNISAYESQFPTLQDWRYYEQSLSPWGREAIDKWCNDTDISGILPPLSFTAEENNTITQIMSQVDTYVEENINKIVVGNQAIESIDEIRTSIKKMGIDKVLKIYNDAYKRYKKR